MSYDKCAWWQELNPGLRQFEAATRSRPATTEHDLALFDPAVAYPSGGDGAPCWWLGEGVQSTTDAMQEVRDATGDVGRTFHACAGGRGAGPVGRADAAGETWPELRARGPADRSGGDVPQHDPLGRGHDVVHGAAWGVSGTADGGRRGVGDRVEGRHNPWIGEVTGEDLVAQHEFGMRMRDQVDQANRP